MNPLYTLAAIAVAVALAAGAGELHGRKVGRDAVQAEWNEAKLAAVAEAEKVRREAFVLSEQLEADLTALKGKYAIAISQRRKALEAQVVCPVSGQIGDLVVPAAVVRSMFNSPDVPGDAGPAPAQPADGMRQGVADTRR